MRLDLVGRTAQIAEALNRFPPKYHDGYFRVRKLARAWGSNGGSSDTEELAAEMMAVLHEWGAGKRKAPSLTSAQEFRDVLIGAEFRADIAELMRLSSPVRYCGALEVNGHTSEFEAFEVALLRTLSHISSRMFVNNTNITYPTKSLLLLASIMPAIDSRVRRGLKRAGAVGVNGTQFLLPSAPNCRKFKMIARLPFLVNQCWKEFQNELQTAIHDSRFPALDSEPARTIDILLFQQAEEYRPKLLVLA